MFAVLKTGGKQYRVQSGDVLRVEKLAAEPGDKVQFNDILMIGGTIGAPPTIINALIDALSPLGVDQIDMPATPLRVWETIQRAKGKQAAA